jgi:hypothetical protein
LKTLSFNETDHIYTLQMDDGKLQVIPSATQIVSVVTGKDLSSIPAATLKKATDRGNKIHKEVEAGVDGGDESYWIDNQIDRTRCNFELKGFAEIAGILYAGTVDIVSGSEIMDIKSQAKADTLAWTIQLNLYRQFYSNIDTLSVLWVPKTGVYRRIPISILSPAQMDEIIYAYRDGRVLPKDFLSAPAPEAPSMELVIYKNTAGELVTNANTILAAVQKQLATYDSDNYSESNIADAKRDKAELNAAARKLNDRRIELEREYLAPFQLFKGTIAETCELIKKASAQIDTVVKEVESRDAEQKRGLIEDFFSTLNFDLVPLRQFWQNSWLNKGTKLSDIHGDITEKVSKIRSDLAVLEGIEEPEARVHYLDSLDLGKALAEATRVKELRERLAAPAPAAPVMTPRVHAPEIAAAIKTGLLTRTFRVECDMDGLVGLSQYMNANNIRFEKL